MANPILTVLTGENGFSLREERARWREEFRKKHGDENLLTVDGATLEYRTFLDEIGSMPFGAAKRLLIVDGIPKFSKEEINQIPAVQHPDTIVLIIDAKPDKRLGGVKALLDLATVKSFAPLSGKPLRDWMAQFVSLQKKSITGPAIEALVDLVGEDQDILATELRKLCLVPKDSITPEDVRSLAVPLGDREVWALTSLLVSGKSAEALAYAHRLLDQGEDRFSLWAMLLWMLRSIVAVRIAIEDGESSPAAIASKSGVPFPTVRTLQPAMKSCSLASLSRLLDWAVASDFALKTGGYRATVDAPQELEALTSTLILKTTSCFGGGVRA